MNYIIEDIALLYDLKSADFFLLRMDNYFYDENKNKICNKKLCNFTLSCICEYILNILIISNSLTKLLIQKH